MCFLLFLSHHAYGRKKLGTSDDVESFGWPILGGGAVNAFVGTLQQFLGTEIGRPDSRSIQANSLDHRTMVMTTRVAASISDFVVCDPQWPPLDRGSNTWNCAAACFGHIVYT